MSTKKFQRTKEDFVCQNCGQKVLGTGYTNHCPRCLWSRHVDVNPGDRLAACRGLMEPVELEKKDGGYVILHRCIRCDFERKNKAAEGDNFEVILKLSGS